MISYRVWGRNTKGPGDNVLVVYYNLQAILSTQLDRSTVFLRNHLKRAIILKIILHGSSLAHSLAVW